MPTPRSLLKLIHKEIDRAKDFHVGPTGLVPAELAFAKHALEKMMPVHRPSWPDFMVLTETDGLIFVEVKGKTDQIRPGQRRTFNILTRHGHKVFIWHEERPDRLTRWAPNTRSRLMHKKNHAKNSQKD